MSIQPPLSFVSNESQARAAVNRVQERVSSIIHHVGSRIRYRRCSYLVCNHVSNRLHRDHRIDAERCGENRRVRYEKAVAFPGLAGFSQRTIFRVGTESARAHLVGRVDASLFDVYRLMRRNRWRREGDANEAGA